MSKYTIEIDQFILNKLQPDIDALNLSLISMEENGYDNIPMRETRRKLNKLVTVYDFLKEYAHGNEEIDKPLLDDIMKIVGSYSTSNKSGSKIVQSTRDSLDINETGGCLEFIRIYINDEISISSVLPPSINPVTLKIFGPSTANSIQVTITVTGSTPKIYYGVNRVTIDNVTLNDIDGIILDIVVTNICGNTFTKKIVYDIQDISCSSVIYYIGNTIERFKISATDLNESSNITINPNSGSNTLGISLTYGWVIANPDIMKEFIYREDTTQTVTVNTGDSHALMLVPITLELTDVKELVSGTPVDMTFGLHYDSFPITSPTLKQYNCIYFRDLTSLTFPIRTFQFNINKI